MVFFLRNTSCLAQPSALYKGEWLGSHTDRFTLGERAPVLIRWEAGCRSESQSERCAEERNLQFSDHPACSLITVLNEPVDSCILMEPYMKVTANFRLTSLCMYFHEPRTQFYSVFNLNWSQDKSVWRQRSRDGRDTLSPGTKDFSFLNSIQTGSGIHPAPYPSSTRGFFNGDKAVGMEIWTFISM
jgi:hypothetical protein